MDVSALHFGKLSWLCVGRAWGLRGRCGDSGDGEEKRQRGLVVREGLRGLRALTLRGRRGTASQGLGGHQGKVPSG